MKKLIEALKLIKETCEHTDCGKCPMTDNRGECILQQDCPTEWNILDEPITVTKVMS